MAGVGDAGPHEPVHAVIEGGRLLWPGGGVIFEQWLEGSVVGLVVSCAEPVEHVVSLPSPDGA
jgi:hypothetical protein